MAALVRSRRAAQDGDKERENQFRIDAEPNVFNVLNGMNGSLFAFEETGAY